MAAPPDAGRDPFGSGSTDDGPRVDDGYLADLLSFSVTQLNREPERLKEQGERAVIARRETAQRRYDAFVGASECYDVVRREVADVERGLEAMRASLPALRAGCQTFAVRAEQISKARAAHRRTLANQSALLDLLEAPSLQDTCVRHGNYDEALEIQSFVDKALRRHGDKKIAAIAQIGEGSRRASDAMLAQLLDKLRDPHVTLPECLKVVGVLRRVAAAARVAAAVGDEVGQCVRLQDYHHGHRTVRGQDGSERRYEVVSVLPQPRLAPCDRRAAAAVCRSRAAANLAHRGLCVACEGRFAMPARQSTPERARVRLALRTIAVR